MSAPVQAASALSRAWVRLYTTRLPEPLRDARRAELNADLWEHQHDRQASRTAAGITATEIMLRTCLGIFDDLAWRFEVLRALRGSTTEGRVSMLRFTSRQTRWMGLAGLMGGLLWAVNLVSLTVRHRSDYPVAWDRVVPIVVAALLLAGLVGFVTSYREVIGRKGSLGVSLLIAAMASYLLANTSLIHDPFLSMLGAGFVFLPIPGFVLVGLALKGSARVGALLVAVAGPLGMVIWARYGAAAPQWFRADSPVNLTYFIYFMLAAAWLAAAGYSTYRQAQRPA